MNTLDRIREEEKRKKEEEERRRRRDYDRDFYSLSPFDYSPSYDSPSCDSSCGCD
jgi:hypothetical protein